MATAIPLTAFNIEGFVDHFLIDHFEDSHAVAPFHREWWEMTCSNYLRVAIAAPRGHAKTTAINHVYGLAAALFQQCPFQLKISRTYKLAVERIKQAKDELLSNRRIVDYFDLRKLEKDTEDDFIAVMGNGYKFRMVAVSSEQEGIRGLSWGTMRPQLVIGDDMESDDQVLSSDRREKMFRWWMNTIMPIGDKRTRYRVIGTVQHNDSLLTRLINNPSWETKVYEGCDEELSEFLWPDMYPRSWWKAKKEEYRGFGNLSGFNMEYRNIAIDTSSGFFRPEDFRPMTEDDHKRIKTYYVGGDMAFSQKQGRDYTVFVVGGVDDEGLLHIVDVRRGRWDGNQVIDEMYSIHEAWEPEEWFIESGAIKETLGAALEIRMREEGFFNLAPGLVPTKDKAIRAMPAQARCRARGVRFDRDASWFPAFEMELLEFSQEGTRGKHDDQVDAFAWLGQGLKRMVTPLTADEVEAEELEVARSEAMSWGFDGRSHVTGY